MKKLRLTARFKHLFDVIVIRAEQTGIQRAMGEMLPSWYYGYSYQKWNCDLTVYHVIPLNFIIRWSRNILHAWNKFRSRPSWVDKIIKEEKLKEWKKAMQYVDYKIEQKVEEYSRKQ